MEHLFAGSAWSVLDERSGQTFAWRRQTRPFKISDSGEYQH